MNSESDGAKLFVRKSNGTVLTYPDVIETIKADGWTVIAAERPQQK